MTNGNTVLYATMVAAGIAIPIMAAINAGVGQRIGAPTAAAFTFVAASLAAALFAHWQGGVRLDALPEVSAKALLTGGIIAFYLLSITLIGPKIGIGTAILLVLMGQIVSSAVIDTFGLLGAPKVPLSGQRVLGTLLVMIGVVLARKPLN